MADESATPSLSLARYTTALERAASLVERGRDMVLVLSQRGFTAVAASYDHSFALKRDGSLWAWGHNGVGQLGLGDRETRFEPTRVGADSDWAAAVASRWHTLALKRDGSLWAWGSNKAGQLGLGDREARFEPTRVGADSDWA
ncbi:MAG: hypothetical protein QM323_09135, partial [Acidobacteriota bacterium]|nr:hypothetical protein [Acidobacteriota bacterium]